MSRPFDYFRTPMGVSGPTLLVHFGESGCMIFCGLQRLDLSNEQIRELARLLEYSPPQQHPTRDPEAPSDEGNRGPRNTAE